MLISLKVEVKSLSVFTSTKNKLFINRSKGNLNLLNHMDLNHRHFFWNGPKIWHQKAVFWATNKPVSASSSYRDKQKYIKS